MNGRQLCSLLCSCYAQNLAAILVLNLGDFKTAYRIVAWLCWVPNVLIGWWIVGRVAEPEI